MAQKLRARPVTSDNWGDFARLFEARGGPHYCFCTPYRFRDAPTLEKAEKKTRMRALVRQRTPIGVLAYDGDEPVGWCSIAPRETLVRLERSRSMPRATPPSTPTWTILCFFVPRSRRKQGVSHALLEGALAYAKKLGAEVVEGYPYDTAGVTATHHGHSSVFEAAGFERDGKRWRKTLKPRR